MSKYIIIASVPLALVLCGCAVATPRGGAVLTPGEVGRAEEGATVKVRGYLVFGSHARQLWSSERAAGNNDIEDCVTLVNTLPLREQLSQSSRRIVTITGRAFRDVLTGRVDLGACSQVGLLVQTVENAEVQRGGEHPRGEDGRRFANSAIASASIQGATHDGTGDSRATVPAFSSNRSARNPVFVNPAHYSSREIEVCGQVDGPNLLESADRRQRGRTGGISIIERGPLNQRFRGRACVAGRLEYMGCRTDICTDAAFDYAIRISRVIRAEGREN